MPSAKSRLVLGALRSGRSFFSKVGATLMNVAPPNEEHVAELPLGGVRGEYLEIGDVPALLLTPEGAPDNRIVMHCHGGAYVSGGLLQARAIAALVSQACGMKVLTFSYRLAPEHPFPAALEDAAACWRYLLAQGYAPEHIGLTGESAGGNLALALTLGLRDRGYALPCGLSLMSPWADLRQTGESYTALKDVDATLDGPQLYQSALDYVGGDEALLDNPLISPIYASYVGFPPVQIHAGTSELLLSDAEMLSAAMRRDGVRVTLMRWEGMCHVFQAFGFSESKLSLKAIGGFLRLVLLGESPEEGGEDHGSV